MSEECLPDETLRELGDCPICLASMNSGCDIVKLSCGHHFHGQCAVTSLQHHNRCPLCRDSIPPPDNGEFERVVIDSLTDSQITTLMGSQIKTRQLFKICQWMGAAPPSQTYSEWRTHVHDPQSRPEWRNDPSMMQPLTKSELLKFAREQLASIIVDNMTNGGTADNDDEEEEENDDQDDDEEE